MVGVCHSFLQTKLCHFPEPFSDPASKIHMHFQAWSPVVSLCTSKMVNHTLLHQRISLLTSLSFSTEVIKMQNNIFMHFCGSLENHTQFQTQEVKTIPNQKNKFHDPIFKPQQVKNDILWGGTYLQLYS